MSARRILLVVGMVAGGAGRHVHELTLGLLADGWQVSVACPAPVQERYDFAAARAHVVIVQIAERPHPVADARTMRTLRRLCRAQDVIHAHGLRAAAMAALAASDAPVVATLHNTAPAGPARVIFQALERVVAARARVVLAVSPDLEQRLRDLGATDVRLAVVAAPPRPAAPTGNQAASLPAHRPAAASLRAELAESQEVLALVVGRLAPQKDLDLLLDALHHLGDQPPGTAGDQGDRGDQPPVRVLVAGEGPLRAHLAHRIDREQLPVRLLGHRTDVPALLDVCDLVVSSAAWEGQPVWLQEALQAGRAVVATDVGGTATVVGGAALLVPHADPAALGGAIARVAHDPAYRSALEERAVTRAAELPDREAAVRAAVRVYHDVLADARG